MMTVLKHLSVPVISWIVLVTLIFLSSCAYSQPHFIKSYATNSSSAIFDLVQTPSGNIVACGNIRNPVTTKQNGLVIGLNPSGDTLWTRVMSYLNFDFSSRTVVLTADSNIVLASQVGNTVIPSGFTFIHLCKIDPVNGDTLWSKALSDAGTSSLPQLHSMDATADGGVIVSAGMLNLNSGITFQATLLRFDSNGNLLWRKAYSIDNGLPASVSIAGPVKTIADGGFIYAAGYEFSSNRSKDIFLIRTDSNGNVIWSKVFGKTGTDQAIDIIPTADDSYLILGNIPTDTIYSNNPALIKVDTSGAVQWVKTFGDTSLYGDGAAHLSASADGGYLFSGWLHVGAGIWNPFIVKTDASGDTVFTHIVADTLFSLLYSHVIENSDGSFMSGGALQVSPGVSNGGILKIDSTGFSDCVTQHFTLKTTIEVLSDTAHTLILPPLVAYNYANITYDISSGITTNTICENWTEVPEFVSTVSFNLYPNPARDILSMDFTLEQPGKIVIEMSNILNESIIYSEVHHLETGKNHRDITVSNLANGIYLIRITEGNKTVTRKLVKM